MKTKKRIATGVLVSSGLLSLLFFQNCKQVSGVAAFEATVDGGPVSLPTPSGAITEDVETPLSLQILKEQKSVTEVNLEEVYRAKFSFDRSYQHPRLCMTVLGNESDCELHTENFTDLSALKGEYLFNGGITVGFIQTDTSAVIKNLFPRQQNSVVFVFYFISEHHSRPVQIGQLKVVQNSLGTQCVNTQSAIDECRQYSSSTGIACMVVDKFGSRLHYSMGVGPMKRISLDCGVAPAASSSTTSPSGASDGGAGSSGVPASGIGSSVCKNTGGAQPWTTFSRPGLNIQGVLPGGSVQSSVSYQFVVDKTKFPYSAELSILPSSAGQYEGREIFISECPNDFDNPPAGNRKENCGGVVGPFARLTTKFPEHSDRYSSGCIIEHGKTYYLNMRTVKDYWGEYTESSYLLGTGVNR